MLMKTTAKLKNFLVLGSSLGILMTATAADATVITFDDLANFANVTNGYNGLNWNNFGVINGPQYSNLASGYTHGVVSSPNVAFDLFGSPASISVASGTFSLGGFYLTAAWNTGLDVRVTGFNGVTQLNSVDLIVNPTGPTAEALNWSGLTSVTFSPSGGTDAGLGGGGTHFALDNLTINEAFVGAPAPIPGAGLASLAAMAIGAFRARKRRA
jgi:hypothetical protein